MVGNPDRAPSVTNRQSIGTEGVFFVHDFMKTKNVYLKNCDFVGDLHGITRIR